ncbi:MAG: nitrite reductase small subunit NirD [Verrucomicrobiota bacterium]
MTWSNLVAVSEMPAGRGLTVRVGDREVALFCIDGEYHAIDGRCPHRGGPLGEGWLENGVVSCPLHGWEFDVKTGKSVNAPDCAVRRFPVRVVDGQIQVCL